MRCRMTFKKDINGEEKTVVRVGGCSEVYCIYKEKEPISTNFLYGPAIDRLAAYEDTRYSPYEINSLDSYIKELKKENEKLKKEIQLLKNTHCYVSNENIDEETLKFFMECKPTVSLTCAIEQDEYVYVLTKRKIEEK